MVQILRGVCIIAVVMIHTTPQGQWQVFCRPFINFAVGTFLFLSGYLTKMENEDWMAFYKKRIMRVVIPYVIWTLVYTIFDKQDYHWKSMVANIITAKGAGQLYFIPVYIQFVLLTPLLAVWAKSRYRWLGWWVSPVSMAIFVYYGIFTATKPPEWASMIWAVACLPWFTFYFLGLVLGNHIITRRFSFKVLVVLYLISLVLQMAEGYGWWADGQPNCGTQVKISALLTSSLFVIMVHVLLSKGARGTQNKLLRWIGDYSFGIYLCHVWLIHLMNHWIGKDAIPYPVNSLAILLVSLGFCLAVDHVCGQRICRWLGIK